MELKSKADIRKEFEENGCRIHIGCYSLIAERDGIHLYNIYPGMSVHENSTISVFDADAMDEAFDAFCEAAGVERWYILAIDSHKEGYNEIAKAKDLDALKHLAQYQRGEMFVETGYTPRMVITDGHTGEIKAEYEAECELKVYNFSVRTYNCLIRAGYYTLNSLRGLSYEDLLSIRNLGKRCALEVMLVLFASDGIDAETIQRRIDALGIE